MLGLKTPFSMFWRRTKKKSAQKLMPLQAPAPEGIAGTSQAVANTKNALKLLRKCGKSELIKSMFDDVLKYMSSYLSYFDLASSSESAGRQAGSQSCSATAWWLWVMAHMALNCTAWPRARTHLAWTGWLRRPKKQIRRFHAGILKASFLWISESICSIFFPSQNRLDCPLLVASIHPEHVEPGETTVLRYQVIQVSAEVRKK